MNIVVTGATSFVGTGAVKELLKRGHHVYAVVRLNSSKLERLLVGGALPENLTILEEDLGTLSNLKSRIEGGCEVFLHMGWRGAGSDCRANGDIQKENERDALQAVSAAKELGCGRFLFTGSQAEYGIHDSLMTEETDCSPSSPYGAAKLAVRYGAEKLCLELGMDYGHARIFSTYGPGDHPWSLISACMGAFHEDKIMELSDCTQKWNFMYIEDAGRAIADLAQFQGSLLEHGCVYNLAGPMEETKELREFVEQLYTMCGRRGGLKYGVRLPNAEGVVNLIPSTLKMEQVVGWAPKVSFEQGILKILRKL